MGLFDRLRQLRGEVPDDDIAGRTEALVVRGNEFGFDEFGLSRDSFRSAAHIARWLYRNYFRTSAFGIEHIPASGRVLFVANHSGQLPYDGLVIGAACFLEPQTPRLVRSMVEYFVPTVPFASYLLARWGQIIGTPENCRRLLAAEEAVLVFPEGARGISKNFSRRYQLAEFGKGFMRLALEMQAPIVPIAVIGAEEQAPAINIKPLARLLRSPSFPVVPYPPFVPLVPLPVKYRLYFGEPIRLTGDPDDDDEVLDEKSRMVKHRIESLIHQGLREREHVFW
ncbi:MAG TPA: lysophospholipid acyltransferase family protein [Kofleriaceae bacterium]|nr:lysophospholipid acyltransferase family protein [Kofleriaceae bacterium]